MIGELVLGLVIVALTCEWLLLSYKAARSMWTSQSRNAILEGIIGRAIEFALLFWIVLLLRR